MDNTEQEGLNSGIGTPFHPIQLPELVVHANMPWYKRAWKGFTNFVNDEILLNKNNIRVKNAQAHPKTMDAVQEGGNIAGAIATAPAAIIGAAAVAPIVMPIIEAAGQALTPSTWIGGISSAAGYQTPTWMLNGADLAASTYFANEAGKEIDRDGLTLKTGINAALSLAPMTKSTEAIEGVANTFRRPVSSVSSVVNDFRAARNVVSSPETILGREFNRSIENTQFINTPVEHVSPNGVTKGASLDRGNEGIHLSTPGASTTPKVEEYILRQGQFPFVRTGTWTYSNNTIPVEVQDLGYFGRGTNPDFDAKVDNGIINFSYTNNFEGQGNTSYLTVEPSFGLQLSRNTINPQKEQIITFQKGIIPSDILANGTGIRTTIKPEVINKTQLQGYTQFGGNYANLGTGGSELSQEAVNRFITPSINELMDFYKSGFYARRLSKAGLLSKRNKILAQKRLNLDATKFGVNTSNNMGNAYAWTGWDNNLKTPYGILEYNIDDNFTPIRYATLHEGSHSSSLNLPEIDRHNKNLLVNIWDNVKPEMKNDLQVKQYIDYITDAAKNESNPNASVSEMAGQLQNAFIHMQQNNLSVNQLLNDADYIRTDHELRNAITVFKPEFLKKLLAPGGIISSVLLAINNKNDNIQ